jgi:hypothetical protein
MTEPSTDGAVGIAAVLKTTLELVKHSIHPGWPDEDPAACAQVLQEMLACIEGGHPCPKYANVQFAPTGPIQEIAIANDWHDRYLVLADAFDQIQSS